MLRGKKTPRRNVGNMKTDSKMAILGLLFVGKVFGLYVGNLLIKKGTLKHIPCNKDIPTRSTKHSNQG